MRNGNWKLIDENFGVWECIYCDYAFYFNTGDPLENSAYYCPCCGALMVDKEKRRG